MQFEAKTTEICLLLFDDCLSNRSFNLVHSLFVIFGGLSFDRKKPIKFIRSNAIVCQIVVSIEPFLSNANSVISCWMAVNQVAHNVSRPITRHIVGKVHNLLSLFGSTVARFSHRMCWLGRICLFCGRSQYKVIDFQRKTDTPMGVLLDHKSTIIENKQWFGCISMKSIWI